MTEESTALDGPTASPCLEASATAETYLRNDGGLPAPVDKPRRHWRVTKADLEAQVVAAAEIAEARTAECALLREQQVAWQKRADEGAGFWAAVALAGWAAFAVAVVWW